MKIVLTRLENDQFGRFLNINKPSGSRFLLITPTDIDVDNADNIIGHILIESSD